MVIICFFIPKLSQYMILAHCGIYYPSKIPADRDRWQNFFTPKTRFLRFTILESRFKIGPSLGKYNSHQENFGFGHCLLKTVFFIHISHQKKIMKTGLIFPKHYQNRFLEKFFTNFHSYPIYFRTRHPVRKLRSALNCNTKSFVVRFSNF